MIVYRIAKAKYVRDLSGYGAYLVGGRWTLAGTYALYTATSRSLAYLEYLIHQVDRELWPVDIEISTINVKDHPKIINPDTGKLPDNWRDLELHSKVQLVGSNYLQQGNLGIIVPSVIVPKETNLILNPLHPDFKKVVSISSIESLKLDERFNRKKR